MTDITPEALEALSKKAEQTEDDIRYYSGGSKYNEPLEQLKDRLVHLYRTGQLIHAVPSGDEVEAVKAAIKKAVGDSPFLDFKVEIDDDHEVPETLRDHLLHTWLSEHTERILSEASEVAATAAITALDAHRGKQKAPAKPQWFKDAQERDRENAPDYGTHGRGWE